ncbi:MAG: NUDIX domain-containing protein [Phycisphaeraceae bacterium]
MPSIRTDIIDVYVFRRDAHPHGASSGIEFLQLHRATGALQGTWQTIMGHVHNGETGAQTALRELQEETGFGSPAAPLLGFWQLEEVNTFFLASHDSIVLSACFAVEVAPDSEPVLNEEHDASRWVRRDHADRAFTWPGQRNAIAAICRDLLPLDSPMREMLRLTTDKK